MQYDKVFHSKGGTEENILSTYLCVIYPQEPPGPYLGSSGEVDVRNGTPPLPEWQKDYMWETNQYSGESYKIFQI